VTNERKILIRVSIIVFFVIAGGLTLTMWGCPKYTVWQQGLAGEAQLRHAEYSRQIIIQEAHAKKEASKMLADAEVERAKGVAEANKIIGDSLKNNEDYLRYLWIHNLEAGNNSVIYIPTEAGLPILEAGKRGQK
jgi:regulator of protease activity HflC (stomatin/prohibitin superfamily)